jgi:hypothetical protein
MTTKQTFGLFVGWSPQEPPADAKKKKGDTFQPSRFTLVINNKGVPKHLEGFLEVGKEEGGEG